jgi:histidyl-tRNA synthetase
VALRFDLTVPFARFLAEHRAELNFPFKRYHIAKVWRGENTQKGRYREFMQCDFDIIGSKSVTADFEILFLIYSVLHSLHLDIKIHINHRGLFNLFLAKTGIEKNTDEILRIADKIPKTGIDEAIKNLSQIYGEKIAMDIIDYISPDKNTDNCNNDTGILQFNKTLSRLTKLSGGISEMSKNLDLIAAFLTDTGIADSFVFDPSITRGLDYYTGIVFETFLADMPDIGSICSGGRYDNLCGLYSKKAISGIGASIGLDRMMAALECNGKLNTRNVYAIIAIACIDAEQAGKCQILAEKIRSLNIPCEVLIEGAASDPVKHYIAAEKRGIRWLIIPEKNPLADPLTLRNISERKNQTGLSITEILAMTANL